MSDKVPIYLALSGGGVRAMAFHAGVIKFLAETNSCERVREISTVSGGSLLIGLVYSLNGMKWPSSKEYENHVFADVQHSLTKNALESKLTSLFFEFNITGWKNRVLRLSKALEKIWGITGRLGELEATPQWIVNATSAETGKRAYFSEGRFKCFELGSTDANDFSICDVIAMSAAYPGWFGPYIIDPKKHIWTQPRKFVASTDEDARRFEKLHIYDGGVYDNLGLEEFKNVGYGTKKKRYENGVIIASDAGKPFKQGFSQNALDIDRVFDLFAIASEQVRSLRSRDFNAYLKQHPESGAHIRIGIDAQKAKENLDKSAITQLQKQAWQSKEDVQKAARTETGLQALSLKDWDRLTRHGYECAEINLAVRRVKGFS